MTSRIRMILGLTAIVALVAALAGSAVAAKPQNPGSQGKNKPTGTPGMKYGVYKATGGATVLTPDAGTAAALSGAGVAIGIAGTTTLDGSNPSFPISKGRLLLKKGNKGRGMGAKKKLIAGYLNHAGAQLTLTKDATVVTLSDFRITYAAGRTGGSLSGEVNGSGPVRLGSLSEVAVDATNKTISAKVTLTKKAVTALNGAFALGLTGTPALGTIVSAPTS